MLFLFLRAEQSSEQRHDGREPFPPSLKLLCSIQIKFCVLGSSLRERLQTLEPVSASRGHRNDAFAQDAGHELAEAEFGLIDHTASSPAVRFRFVDGTERPEELQALAGGAFADVQALDYVGKAQGRRRGVEQAVDLADGLGYSEELHNLGKERDAFGFECAGYRCDCWS